MKQNVAELIALQQEIKNFLWKTSFFNDNSDHRAPEVVQVKFHDFILDYFKDENFKIIFRKKNKPNTRIILEKKDQRLTYRWISIFPAGKKTREVWHHQCWYESKEGAWRISPTFDFLDADRRFGYPFWNFLWLYFAAKFQDRKTGKYISYKYIPLEGQEIPEKAQHMMKIFMKIMDERFEA